MENELYQEEEKKNIAGDFSFLTEKDAAIARQEIKKVMYLERALNNQSIDVLIKIYEKAVHDRTFRTPVGLSFVAGLRNRLINEGVEEENLKPIPVYYDIASGRLGEEYHEIEKQEGTLVGSSHKKNLSISVLINIILAALVAGMFAVAMTGDNPNILNYKRAVENQYAAWEQDLSERENAVREKELAFQKQP